MGSTLTSACTRDSLGYWQDVVCGVFVPLSCRPLTNAPFEWRIKSDILGALQLADLSVVPHQVEHTRRHAEQSDNGYFLLSQQLDGRCAVIQDHREAVLNPGDFALYDAARPYELHFPTPMRQRILRLPHELVATKLSRSDTVTARRIDGSSGLGRVFSSLIAGAFDATDNLLASEAGAVTEAVTDLLAVVASQQVDRDWNSRRAPAALLRERMVRFIEANLTDPALGVELIAQAHGVTARYVHLLFQAETTTVTKLIWTRRVERAAALLTDPTQTGVAVSQIAYGCGFVDAAHFSRAFKERFGCSPRAYRSGHHSGA